MLHQWFREQDEIGASTSSALQGLARARLSMSSCHKISVRTWYSRTSERMSKGREYHVSDTLVGLHASCNSGSPMQRHETDMPWL